MMTRDEAIKQTIDWLESNGDAGPVNWTRNTWACDARYRSLAANDPQASCWCAIGYLQKLLPTEVIIKNYGFDNVSADEVWGRVLDANDNRGPLYAAAELRKILGESE